MEKSFDKYKSIVRIYEIIITTTLPTITIPSPEAPSNKVKHPGFTMTLQSCKTWPLQVGGWWPIRKTSLYLSWQLHLQLLKVKGKEEKKQCFKAKDGAHFVCTSIQGCNDLCCRPLETSNPIRTGRQPGKEADESPGTTLGLSGRRLSGKCKASASRHRNHSNSF